MESIAHARAWCQVYLSIATFVMTGSLLVMLITNQMASQVSLSICSMTVINETYVPTLTIPEGAYSDSSLCGLSLRQCPKAKATFEPPLPLGVSFCADSMTLNSDETTVRGSTVHKGRLTCQYWLSPDPVTLAIQPFVLNILPVLENNHIRSRFATNQHACCQTGAALDEMHRINDMANGAAAFLLVALSFLFIVLWCFMRKSLDK